MYELSVIQSNNLLEIISLGEDISSRIKSNTNQITIAMERALQQKDSSIVKSIDKILAKIDINEVSEFTNRKSGLQGLVDKVKNTKRKIEEKYTSIVKELGNMESTALMWRNDLKEINSMLENLKRNNEVSISELLILREQLIDEVERVKQLDNTPLNKEKQVVLSQKINDVNLKIQTLEQINNNIDVVAMTNYNTYKNVMTIYDTTIPMIETQISIKSITAHHRVVAEGSKYVIDRNSELIVSTAKEIIKSGEEAIQLLGDTSNFEALRSAKKMIEDGKLMLEKKQNEEILKIEANIRNIQQLEGGVQNVNLIN